MSLLWLKPMHNVINSTFTKVDIEQGGIAKFASEGQTRKSKNDLSFCQELGCFFDPCSFIVSTKTDETIDLHTMQVTQIVNLLKVKTKTIFYVGCDDLGLSMAIIPYVHALHL